MSDYTTANVESTEHELSTRERRALEQYLTVTPAIGRARGCEGLAVVSSQSGREYLVDVETGRCQRTDGAVCPDQEYNLGGGDVCKHVIRARIELGERPVSSAELATADVDPQLGEHTNGPVVVTPDGGVIDAGDEGEIVDAGGERIEGPFPEINKYGNYSGHDYYRCGRCGAEAMREKDLSDCCEGGR